MGRPLRNLVVILGDQLTEDSAALQDFDAKQDAVWMVEAKHEGKKVWSHKARIALFLSAMRHFRDHLVTRGFTVDYRQLDDPDNLGTFEAELRAAAKRLKPRKVVLMQPGEWGVKKHLLETASNLGTELELRADSRFICSEEEFERHAEGRKQLRMEFFYREIRRKLKVLMDEGSPVGGKWNFDTRNRGSFSKTGPPVLNPPIAFKPDGISRDVLTLVDAAFADHPGSLNHFDWPVTTPQAEAALEDFIEHRLPLFGQFQDAMWEGGGRLTAFLFHSRLSAAMNLGLLHPMKAIRAAEDAYLVGDAPVEAVEGFIRQVLGWREYVRGVYWKFMPDYLQSNALNAHQPLPAFYWDANTDMNCLRCTIQQTLDHGYAHHIQRLMVSGLFALLLGVSPQSVHEWYLAIYVDAVEWVELPNTLGMSQYADGGIMASKPYVASGKYIQRMSNYCAGCRYNPGNSTGETACPFTTLYWDFLARHEVRLATNQRMAMQLRNLNRLDNATRTAITEQAERLRERFL